MMRGFRGIRTSRIKAAKRFLYVKRRTSFSGKEKKSDADVARIHGKKEKNRLVCDIAKKEKEIRAGFSGHTSDCESSRPQRVISA